MRKSDNGMQYKKSALSNICTSFKLTTRKTHRTQDCISMTHNGKHNIHDMSYLLKW